MRTRRVAILIAMRVALLGAFVAAAALSASPIEAQRRRPAVAPVTIELQLECPYQLGMGAATRRSFCDIQTGTDPEKGAIVRLPARQGVATLMFDLHNRHTYSEQLTESGRGYRRATATIGVLTMDGNLLTRALVMTEFRKATDLFDRIEAGPGLSGVKAVAPIGAEPIAVEIPEKIEAVSLLGEKLVVVRSDVTETIVTPDRPVASVSNLRIEYRPRSRRR
jgi:hypothetical protein